MGNLSIDTMYDMNAQEQELMHFECWYHSVIDAVALMIKHNGYETVMLDVMQAVERMSKEHSSVRDTK